MVMICLDNSQNSYDALGVVAHKNVVVCPMYSFPLLTVLKEAALQLFVG